MNDELVRALMARMPSDQNLEIPPKVFLDMEGEVVAFEEGKSLTVRFPVKQRYRNPLGAMQGGMIVAAVDNTVGPLSYLVAPPSVTTQLNTSYIRPVPAESRYITVEGRVEERTRRNLLLAAHVLNETGQLVAISSITCAILNA